MVRPLPILIGHREVFTERCEQVELFDCLSFDLQESCKEIKVLKAKDICLVLRLARLRLYRDYFLVFGCSWIFVGRVLGVELNQLEYDLHHFFIFIILETCIDGT